MHKRLSWQLAVIAFLVQAWSALGQTLEPIVYTVHFPDPANNEAQVEAVVPTLKQAAIEMMMPIWTPGFYRVENHAAKVKNFTARTTDGKDLKFELSGAAQLLF